jgi:hypothetical protein
MQKMPFSLKAGGCFMNKPCNDKDKKISRADFLKIGFAALVGTAVVGIMGCKDEGLAPRPNTPMPQVPNFVGDQDSYVFHKPTCRMAPKKDKGVYFDAPMAASNAGYKPCKICKPLEP